jgi:hypothetical protein
MSDEKTEGVGKVEAFLVQGRLPEQVVRVADIEELERRLLQGLPVVRPDAIQGIIEAFVQEKRMESSELLRDRVLDHGTRYVVATGEWTGATGQFLGDVSVVKGRVHVLLDHVTFPPGFSLEIGKAVQGGSLKVLLADLGGVVP